jgi:hypothetical protein
MEAPSPDFSAMISALLDGRVADLQAFLTPVLLLVCWTLIVMAGKEVIRVFL